jgi:hypothetical protein
VSHARRFLGGLPCGGDLAGVTAADVVGAVLRESAAAVSVSATQFFAAGLRSFLRFCFFVGLVPVDLSQAALPATGRRRSLLPQGIGTARRGCVRDDQHPDFAWQPLFGMLAGGLGQSPSATELTR